MSGERTNLRRKDGILVLLLLPLIILFAMVAAISVLINRVSTYLLIWLVWLPRGKDVLFVSSDSPDWQIYMAEQILPLVSQRAVVLNWSERARWPWWSFPAHVFRTFGGNKEFNPLVLVFRPFRQRHCFRFFSVFKRSKPIDVAAADRLRQELISVLN